MYRQIGGVLSLNISKDENGKVAINHPEMDLTFVDANRKNNYQMHLLSDYIAKNPYIETDHDKFDSLEVYSELTERLTQWMPEFKLK